MFFALLYKNNLNIRIRETYHVPSCIRQNSDYRPISMWHRMHQPFWQYDKSASDNGEVLML